MRSAVSDILKVGGLIAAVVIVICLIPILCGLTCGLAIGAFSWGWERLAGPSEPWVVTDDATEAWLVATFLIGLLLGGALSSRSSSRSAS